MIVVGADNFDAPKSRFYIIQHDLILYKMALYYMMAPTTSGY